MCLVIQSTQQIRVSRSQKSSLNLTLHRRYSRGQTAQCVHRWPSRHASLRKAAQFQTMISSGGHSGRQARSETLLTSEVRHRPRHKFAQGKINTLFVCLLFVLSLPVRVHSAGVFCAYANSSCSTCGDLCGFAQFYSLVPSPCHPESTSVRLFL